MVKVEQNINEKYVLSFSFPRLLNVYLQWHILKCLLSIYKVSSMCKLSSTSESLPLPPNAKPSARLEKGKGGGVRVADFKATASAFDQTFKMECAAME